MALCATSSTGTARAFVELYGPITTETTLVAGAVYRVTGSVTVNSGVTLTIPAGTILKAHEGIRIDVQGQLRANGTRTNPIHFTDLRDDSLGGDSNGDGNATAPAPNWWQGLDLPDGGTATLDHTQIRDAGRPASTLVFDTNVVRVGGQDGFVLTAGNEAVGDLRDGPVPNDANGTFELPGSFTRTTFTAVPLGPFTGGLSVQILADVVFGGGFDAEAGTP